MAERQQLFENTLRNGSVFCHKLLLFYVRAIQRLKALGTGIAAK